MGQLILILGGVRSGKSDYAEELAYTLGQDNVLFVATAEAGDAEMARRIATHQQSRPESWRTLEAPQNIGSAIPQHLGNATVVLVDCITLLVSNIMLALGDAADTAQAEHAIQAEIQRLVQTCQDHPITCIAVSNEVGLGVVPDHRLGRLYRDLLGKANQALATQAQDVYYMIAGLAVEVKALATPRPTSPRP